MLQPTLEGRSCSEPSQFSTPRPRFCWILVAGSRRFVNLPAFPPNRALHKSKRLINNHDHNDSPAAFTVGVLLKRTDVPLSRHQTVWKKNNRTAAFALIGKVLALRQSTQSGDLALTRPTADKQTRALKLALGKSWRREEPSISSTFPPYDVEPVRLYASLLSWGRNHSTNQCSSAPPNTGHPYLGYYTLYSL